MKVFPSWLCILLTVLAVGAIYYFSLGLNGLGPLVWIAPIPIILLAFDLTPRTAMAMAFSAFLLGRLTLFSYLAQLMPIGIVIVSLVIPAIAFALAILTTRYAVLYFKHWSTIFVFPAVWTSYEYLLSVVSPHGTAGSLAYTQIDILPLVQIVSLTGLWGVTFLLTLIPACIAVAWHLRRNKKQAVPALVIPLFLGLLSLCFGWVRLAQPISGQSIRVGLAATDTTIRYFRTANSKEALPVVQAYARRINNLAARGAKVIVLPEKFVGVTPAYADDVYRILREAARNNHVAVIAGLNRIGTEHSMNEAVVFSPEGQVVAEYNKIHLVPGFESRYQAGTKPAEFSFFTTTAGVAICKDMDFPGLLSQYARDGVGIVFVPAWDFGQDRQWHARMAMMRGIEGGFAVARSAQNGLLTVSDHLGRMLAEDKSSREADVLLVSDIQPGPGVTFYSMSGDWMAWLNLLFLMLLLTKILFQRWRTRRGKRGQVFD
jgi:apolipoprotein N-acyltransferase